jgi:hypothetical protein
VRKLWKAILRLFGTTPYKAPTSQLSCSVDIDQIIIELGIVKKAKHQGEHNLPRTDSKTLDGNENEIVNYIQTWMTSLTDQANELMVKYDTSIINTNIYKFHERVINLAQHTADSYNSLKQEAKSQLKDANELVENMSDEYLRFKQKHKRDEEPDYPLSKTWHIALIAGLILIESAANTYFFAQGSEFGLSGGYMKALTVAALNVTPAVMFAGLIFMRYFHHISLIYKSISFVLLILYFIWIPIFNLAVAHYRDATMSNVNATYTDVLPHLINNPFALRDIDSWTLFVVGVVFAFVALIDGYKMDDHYPRYGAKHRKLEGYKGHLENVSKEVCEKAVTLRDRFLEELNRNEFEAKGSFVQLNSLVRAKESLEVRHPECINLLKTTCNTLIQKYRDANQKVRKEPPPQYFNNPWIIEREYSLKMNRNDKDIIKRQEGIYEAFPALVQSKLNEIEKLYGGFFDDLESINPIIENPRNPNFEARKN